MYNKEIRRTKMVTFRVSNEVYLALERACNARQARSISDLARNAVQLWLHGAGNGPAWAGPMEVTEAELGLVGDHLQALGQEVERLRRIAQRGSVSAEIAPFGRLRKPIALAEASPALNPIFRRR
jgi:hypothetical protein